MTAVKERLEAEPNANANPYPNQVASVKERLEAERARAAHEASEKNASLKCMPRP